MSIRDLKTKLDNLNQKITVFNTVSDLSSPELLNEKIYVALIRQWTRFQEVNFIPLLFFGQNFRIVTRDTELRLI